MVVVTVVVIVVVSLKNLLLDTHQTPFYVVFIYSIFSMILKVTAVKGMKCNSCFFPVIYESRCK